ncbi:hypothetical protein KX928_12785 [Roseobacter sp. YSTF-M11]|uniref:Uncharacterized protein n=1 Tax=Roseobacter insulae TaxID=2859783 RepID=A0A9X1JYV3_9RHOB|nr:hypothetical protein [Roseobacter insulae]MBW4708661.1 hypothetical protein [Roseobacter insulae]
MKSIAQQVTFLVGDRSEFNGFLHEKVAVGTVGEGAEEKSFDVIRSVSNFRMQVRVDGVVADLNLHDIILFAADIARRASEGDL